MTTPPQVHGARRYGFPLLAYAFVAIMIGTTLPTPIYALYADSMHFQVLTTTVVFASYAVAVLTALLVFGRWSDAIGRRPVLLGGAVLGLLSSVVFLMADDVPLLLLGRLLSGLSAGIFTGTATAAIIEAVPPEQRERGAAIATAANTGGLGIGPVFAGLLVQYAPHPLQLPFIVHIVLVILAAGAVLLAPETSSRTGKIGLQRLTVPAEIRPVFVTAGTAAFAGFAVMGLFTSVSPTFVASVIGNHSHAVAGAVASSVFLTSTAAQLLGRRMAPPRAMAIGCALLVLAMAMLALALEVSSMIGLVAAALVAGTGQGISFSRGLAAVVERTPVDRRAEVSSSYFVIAYVGISLPVVGLGFAAQDLGLRPAGVSFAIAVAVLSAVCLAAVLAQEARARRRAQTDVSAEKSE